MANVEESDIFFRLTASGDSNLTGTCFKDKHNKKWYQKPPVPKRSINRHRRVREKTPMESPGPKDQEKKFPREQLVVTFSGLLAKSKDEQSKVRTLAKGVMFGTDPRDCHVLLGPPEDTMISWNHFAITVDEQSRIWGHDCGSSHGTAVSASFAGEQMAEISEIRVHGSWLLADVPNQENSIKELEIRAGNIRARIEFPNHFEKDPEYLQKLDTLDPNPD